jgi:hypothetical protein
MHPRFCLALVGLALVACGDDAKVDATDVGHDGSGDAADVVDDAAADVVPPDAADGTADSADAAGELDSVEPADADDSGDAADAGDGAADGDARGVSDDPDTDADSPDADPIELFEVDVCAMSAAGTRDGEAWIAVGTGTRDGAYVPLAAPPTMVIGQGLQGGYHLWGGFEGSGFEGATIDTNWCATDLTTDGVIGQAYLTNATAPLEDRFAAGGLTVFLDFSIDPVALADHDIRVCVAAKSASGEIISDCQTVSAVCCDYLDGTGGP